MSDSVTSTSTLKLSVVLPSMDCGYQVRKALQSLSTQTLSKDSFEILLISERRNQARATQFARIFPTVQLRFLSTSGDFDIAEARNIASDNARATTILFSSERLELASECLEAHNELHQLPGNDLFATLCSVAIESPVPNHVFTQALVAGNFISAKINTAAEQGKGFAQICPLGISTSISAFRGNNAIRFTEKLCSEWGSDRELLFALKARSARTARSQKAIAALRTGYDLTSFEKQQRQITADLYALTTLFPEAAELCPTIKAFSPDLLIPWERSLASDQRHAEELVRQVEAVQDSSTRRHTERQALHSDSLIARIAECLLLYKEFIAQKELIALQREKQAPLSTQVEQFSKTKEELVPTAPPSTSGHERLRT